LPTWSLFLLTRAAPQALDPPVAEVGGRADPKEMEEGRRAAAGGSDGGREGVPLEGGHGWGLRRKRGGGWFLACLREG
jgi:hypothetical protein